MPVLTSSRVSILTPRAFEPPHLGGCVLWLAADRVQGLADGNTITTWPDYSGLGNDATQATEANKPTWRTGVVNGQSVLRLDATNDGILVASTLSVARPDTVILIWSGNSDGGNRRALESASNNWLVGPYNNAFQYYNGAFINGGGITAGRFYIQTVVETTTGATLYRDGSSIGSNTQTTALARPAFGASGAIGQPHNGDIAEAIIYNRALGNSELNRVHGYLGRKYNIAVSVL